MNEENKLAVLDHGFVSLVDSMGSDLTVVNSARVSYGKRKTALDTADIKLINYLADHAHWSPFRHVQLQFHCKVPEFVARQWYKHVVGISYTEAATVDHGWNEISLRYADVRDFDLYIPDDWRLQDDKNKQSSGGFASRELSSYAVLKTKEVVDAAVQTYTKLVDLGVAREMARMVLPLNIYTEFYWTCSLQALANFLKLRTHPGAQFEITAYANALRHLSEGVVPQSLKALLVPGVTQHLA